MKPTKRVTLPERFEPHFWQDADGRCSLVKQIKKRVDKLKEDTRADSYQRELLAERAAFVAVQLETMERMAAEQGKFDAGVYTQMTNSLMGLLKALGLDKKVRAIGLKGYLQGNAS